MPKKKEVVYIEDEKKKNLSANMIMHQKKLGFDDTSMATILGCNIQTFQRKRLGRQQFNYTELVHIFDTLQFTPDEILESI